MRWLTRKSAARVRQAIFTDAGVRQTELLHQLAHGRGELTEGSVDAAARAVVAVFAPSEGIVRITSGHLRGTAIAAVPKVRAVAYMTGSD